VDLYQNTDDIDIRISFIGDEEHQKFNDNTSFALNDVGKPIAHAFFPQGLPDPHHLEVQETF